MHRTAHSRIRILSLPKQAAHRKDLLNPQFFWATGGVLVVGIFVPCLLTWLHNHGSLPFFHGEALDAAEPWNLIDWIQLQACALLGCGPGALLLTALLFLMMRRSMRSGETSEKNAMRAGAFIGVAFSFANLPGYLSVNFYAGDPLSIALRIGMLFAVTGATCGAWIAWQVYRERHPDRGLFPRFSLRTLLVCAMAWGLLLALYMPAF